VTDSFAEWDAVETATRIRAKAVSRREVIDAAIARAERAAVLGAIVTPTFDTARAANPSGPFAGVPTFIKDLAQVAGVRTTWGSRSTGEFVSRRSDPSLARWFATGLVTLGKSATPEFGLTAITERVDHPPCRNPWDPARGVGGSSGGAACLVAAGVVPIAHGSDGGGSIRIPAAVCGLVGLKPTRKRFDMEGASLLPVNVAVQGVLTRTVRDTIAFYDALESRGSPIAPIGAVTPMRGRRLRIGLFVTSPIGSPVDPEHRAAAEQTGALCESLGHHVEAIDCPFDGSVIHDFLRYWGFIAFAHQRGGKLLTHRGFDAARLEPWTVGLAKYFTDNVAASLAAIMRLRRVAASYATVMRRYDLLLSPTTAEPVGLHGHLGADVPFDVAYDRLLRFVPATAIPNAAGAPAISLPLGRSTSGLPIGVHFAAAAGDDRTLLQLALALEAAKPWPRVAPATAWQTRG
jgi:amidase